jgi:E3 ubiquitin-protein ligase HUWE1
MSLNGNISSRFTKESVVVTAPTKVKGGTELQLPSMNALTNKTSSQAFFLRVLKVIIQLRESALNAIKKAKQAKAAKEAAQQQQQPPAETAGEADAATPTPSNDTPMEVEESEPAKTDEPECLESLSEELDLSPLWDALSSCLRDLAHTPDHHAVLVLQVDSLGIF